MFTPNPEAKPINMCNSSCKLRTYELNKHIFIFPVTELEDH